MNAPALHFYYAPQSRARSVLAMFEELGVAPEMTVLNLKTGQQREPAYLAVNPMGKVPAITCDGVFGLVSKTPEIAAYIERINARPAQQRAAAREAAYAQAQGDTPPHA